MPDMGPPGGPMMGRPGQKPLGMDEMLKSKPKHSTFSNIFYFLKIMFKISPLLVIGECFWGALMRLPTKIISVLGVKYVIDVISSGDDTSKIVHAVILIGIILVISESINWLYREIFFQVEREKLEKGISQMLYKKARKLDFENYDNPDFYNNFILVIEASSGGITGVLGMVQRYIGEIVSLVTIGGILLAIDPICLLIIILIVAIFTPVGRKIGRLQAERQIENNIRHRKADYFARIFYLQDYCKEVRMNDIKSLLIKRYNSAADEVISNQKFYAKKISIIYFLQECGVQILGFMFVLPLYLGYCVLESKSLSAGDFVASFNGAFQIAASFSFLTVGVMRMFSERAKLIEKYRDFLAKENKIKEGSIEDIEEKPQEIKIENLSFAYPNCEEFALKDINLTVKPYEKIALVGYNGAGKTTLTNLLLRLYDPSSGSIKIGNKDISKLTLDSHRARFAAVFQDFQIFASTIGENVSLDISYDDDAVTDALSQSGFTKPLPKGNETQLLREFDDNGMMMSGGESQKVAIARTFYKSCPYIILDEPSANLDPIAEYNLNQSMITAAKHKTVIFISHRLSTTVNADKIYVMEKGSIIESGTHKQLMEQNGTYAYMFRLQAEKYKN